MAKKESKAKKTTVENKKGVYKIKISCNDTVKEFEADTILEVINAFEPEGYFKTETIVDVTKGNKNYIKRLNVAQAKRVFNGGVASEIFAKDLSIMVN